VLAVDMNQLARKRVDYFMRTACDHNRFGQFSLHVGVTDFYRKESASPFIARFSPPIPESFFDFAKIDPVSGTTTNPPRLRPH
jgi:hypothetical protein